MKNKQASIIKKSLKKLAENKDTSELITIQRYYSSLSNTFHLKQNIIENIISERREKEETIQLIEKYKSKGFIYTITGKELNLKLDTNKFSYNVFICEITDLPYVYVSKNDTSKGLFNSTTSTERKIYLFKNKKHAKIAKETFLLLKSEKK